MEKSNILNQRKSIVIFVKYDRDDVRMPVHELSKRVFEKVLILDSQKLL